jgi:hypothetical protein
MQLLEKLQRVLGEDGDAAVLPPGNAEIVSHVQTRDYVKARKSSGYFKSSRQWKRGPREADMTIRVTNCDCVSDGVNAAEDSGRCIRGSNPNGIYM